MPADLAAELAEFRTRALMSIDAARPGAMLLIVVAEDRSAVQHQWAGTPQQMVDLASSLLDGALDRLRDEGAEACELALQVEDALSVLPDRFADPEPEEAAADA